MCAGRFSMMAVMAILAAVALDAQGGAGQRAGGAPAAPPMTMAIAAFPDGGPIPVKYSQAAPGAAPGEGTSPAITWTNVPPGTQSFFLHMHDMEVVRNKTTDDQAHWVLWNIPGDVNRIAGRRRQGRTASGWQLSNQCDRAGLPRSWRSSQRPAASLHVRALCARYQTRRAAVSRRVRDACERDESDPGTHSRQGGLRRTVQRPQ